MSSIGERLSARRGAVVWTAFLVLLVFLVDGPLPSWAASARLSVSGSVSGDLTAGGRLSVRIVAIEPSGWGTLHQLDAEMIAGGSVADRLEFDIENNLLTLGAQQLFVGTGGNAAGAYFEANGANVIVTTGGPRLEFSVRLRVLRDLPAGATFRLKAVDDHNQSASVLRAPNANQGGRGLAWGTAVAAVAVALFAGGFLGNLFASRRRPAARPSVYSTIQRRIEAERHAAGPTGASKPTT